MQDIASQDSSRLDSDEEDDTLSHDSMNSEERNETPLPILTTPRRLSGKKRLSGPEAVMQEAVSVLSSIKSRKTETIVQNTEDEDDIFGKHVASEMRKIKDARAKGLARLKIQSTLFEAQFDTPPPLLTSTQRRVDNVSPSPSEQQWQGSQSSMPDTDFSPYNRTYFRL